MIIPIRHIGDLRHLNYDELLECVSIIDKIVTILRKLKKHRATIFSPMLGKRLANAFRTFIGICLFDSKMKNFHLTKF